MELSGGLFAWKGLAETEFLANPLKDIDSCKCYDGPRLDLIPLACFIL